MAGFRLHTQLRGFDVAIARFRRGVATVDDKVDIALERAALLGEREIKRGMRSGRPGGQKFKKLSKITKLLTGRSKPLMRSGAHGLWGAVTHVVDKKAKQAFVGVLRTAKSADGDSYMNIALIHEYGTKSYAIKVTDAMRRFFFFLHIKSGGKINPISPWQDYVLHPGVPARPFIRPAMEKIRPKIERIVEVAFTTGGPI